MTIIAQNHSSGVITTNTDGEIDDADDDIPVKL